MRAAHPRHARAQPQARARRRHGRHLRRRSARQAGQPRRGGDLPQAPVGPHARSAHRRGRDIDLAAGRAGAERGVGVAGAFPRARRRRDQALLRDRRALRQGRRLRDPGPCGRVHRAPRRQLFGRHGPAARRDRATARARPASRSSKRTPGVGLGRRAPDVQRTCKARRSCTLRTDARSRRPTHGRRPHQHHAAGNARRRAARRRRAGTAHRAHGVARVGGQHLLGQGRTGAARDAVGIRRHRPGARSLPARGRHLGIAQRGPQRRQRQAAPDRASAARRRRGAGASDQGPDRHQGCATVDADQPRGPHAGVPAAGPAHRRVAEDRERGRARAAARAAHAPDAARRERRLHHPHQRGGRDRRRTARRRRLPAAALVADPRREPPGAGAVVAVPGAVARAARAARRGQRTDGADPGRLARELRGSCRRSRRSMCRRW